MTILAPTTIDLIEDRIRMLGSVTLSAEVCHELLHRAAQSYRMQILLEQAAKEGPANVDFQKWCARILADEKRDRPRLKFPPRLVTIEVG